MTTCYRCGDEGHYAYACPGQDTDTKSGKILK